MHVQLNTTNFVSTRQSRQHIIIILFKTLKCYTVIRGDIILWYYYIVWQLDNRRTARGNESSFYLRKADNNPFYRNIHAPPVDFIERPRRNTKNTLSLLFIRLLYIIILLLLLCDCRAPHLCVSPRDNRNAFRVRARDVTNRERQQKNNTPRGRFTNGSRDKRPAIGCKTICPI